MKYILLLLTSISLFSCSNAQNEVSTYFYVGSYTKYDSDGIYKYKISEEGKLDSIGLVAKAYNPTFLTFNKDKTILLSTTQKFKKGSIGNVSSFKVTPDSLELISISSSGGSHPCFVNVDTNGNVLVANYKSGSVGLLELKNNGSLSELLDLKQHYGSGVHKRQDKAHAHSSYFIPNTNNTVSVDLGTNELWFYTIDNDKLIESKQQKLSMKEGAGPRHLSIHSKGYIYVVNELNSTVSLVVKNNDNKEYEVKSSISTLPEGFTGDNTCADIHISSDEKYLYVSNRGHNSIVVFSIDSINGSLSQLYHYSVEGNWPRNFNITPNGDFLVVANQKSNNIVSFRINKGDGSLLLVDSINAPTPVCILFK